MKNIITWYRDNRDDLYRIANLKVFGIAIVPAKWRGKFLALLKALDAVIIDLPQQFLASNMRDIGERTAETKTLGEIYVQES